MEDQEDSMEFVPDPNFLTRINQNIALNNELCGDKPNKNNNKF